MYQSVERKRSVVLTVVDKVYKVVDDGNYHIVDLVLGMTLFLFLVFTIFNFISGPRQVAVDLEAIVRAIDIDLQVN